MTRALSRPSIATLLAWITLGLAGLILLGSTAKASPPHEIHVQGVLRDALGNAVTGSFSLTFRLYTQASGGVALATETKMVTVTEGLYDVELSTLGNPDLYREQNTGIPEDWHIGVSVSGQAELVPRMALSSVPFAHMSTGVEGDVHTEPGALYVRPLTGLSPFTSSAKILAQSDSAIIVVLDSNKTTAANGRYLLRAGIPLRSSMTLDSDGDGQGDGDMSQSMVPGTTAVAINQKGTGADRNRVAHSMTITPDASSTVTTHDADDDGVNDEEISMSMVPGTTAVAINTKGTGADKNRTATTITVTPDSGSITTTHDADDDGFDDEEMSIVMVPGASAVAIKTKGTGADKNRVIAQSDSVGPRISLTVDDGAPDPDEIEQFVKPGECSVAIKTRGTGADRNRVIAHSDSLGPKLSLTIDDGAPNPDEIEQFVKPGECSVAIKTRGTGADKNRVIAHSDSLGPRISLTVDDGAPDPDEIEQFVKPGECSVAIKTRGTGADRNRVIVTSDSLGPKISMEVDDGDDDPEEEIEQFVKPGECSVAIKTKGTGADKNRVISTTTPDSATHSMLSSDSKESVSMRVRPTGGGTLGNAQMTLLHDDGLAGSSSVSMSSSSSGSDLNLSDDGVTVYRVSSSSGMEIKDGSGTVTSSVDRDGSASFALRLGVGTVATTHPIEHSSGAHLTAGGVWTNASDANLKENFERVDGRELLDQVSRLTISRWNYKNEGPGEPHIGPTAQDFKAVFGVGSDGKSISTIDPSGIALAAIQELHSENQELKRRNEELESRFEALLRKVEMLEKDAQAK